MRNRDFRSPDRDKTLNSGTVPAEPGRMVGLLKDKMKNFVSWSFAIDDSTDVKDAPQLAIFIKGVDKELNETEELLSLVYEGYYNWC